MFNYNQMRLMKCLFQEAIRSAAENEGSRQIDVSIMSEMKLYAYNHLSNYAFVHFCKEHDAITSWIKRQELIESGDVRVYHESGTRAEVVSCGRPMSCSCSYTKSMQLPCVHILAVAFLHNCDFATMFPSDRWILNEEENICEEEDESQTLDYVSSDLIR